VSTQPAGGRPPEGRLPPASAGSLFYLLKHAQLRLADLSGPALEPFGINGRERAVLSAIDGPAPLSQHEVAQRLGVDRTTMVALVDGLEDKGLVQRLPDRRDRRKNVVALTDAGRTTLQEASRAVAEAERRFLAPLSSEQAVMFRKALEATAFADPAEPPPPH
jgi:DNA-binding MarR family transcriptional regulator